MLEACLPDASHLSNATLLRVSPPAQSTTMLSQGSSPDDQGYAATRFIRKPLPTLTTSKKPTTSNPDTNTSANARVHKVENGCKGDRELREMVLGAQLPALQAIYDPWANTPYTMSLDASRRVKMTQNTLSECIIPAPAGQSPNMTKDTSPRAKRVQWQMPPKTQSDETLDASRRVKMTLNNPEGCIEPAEGKQF